jgi:hypothetical protein
MDKACGRFTHGGETCFFHKDELKALTVLVRSIENRAYMREIDGLPGSKKKLQPKDVPECNFCRASCQVILLFSFT